MVKSHFSKSPHKSVRRTSNSDKVNVGVKTSKIYKREKRFFDIVFTMRVNREMLDIMDYWINHPHCVDSNSKPLFVSRSHLVKCSLIKQFNDLKTKYSNTLV